MNKSEAAIGARVKEFRERIEWPQSVFAYEIGITRNKLAGIEYGTTPLRYAVARRMCERCGISPLWLAKGEGSPTPDWPAPKQGRIPDRMLFSAAFKQFYEHHIPKELDDILRYGERTGATSLIPPPAKVPPGRQHEWFVMKAFRARLGSVPRESRVAFCDAVLAKINSLGDAYSADLKGALRLYGSKKRIRAAKQETPESEAGKPIVDNGNEAVKVTAVSSEIPTWKQIVAALKRLTDSPGAKKSLADDLETTRQNVNKWLSGKGAPSAELTLKVFAWVEDHGGWKKS